MFMNVGFPTAKYATTILAYSPLKATWLGFSELPNKLRWAFLLNGNLVKSIVDTFVEL